MIWKSGDAEHRRDVHRRLDPVEERAVRDQPADEEDAENRRPHVSDEGRAGAGQPLEDQRNAQPLSDEARRSRARCTIGIGNQTVAAERGVADRADPPVRRQQPRDRPRPGREERDREQQPGSRSRPGTRAGSRARWRGGRGRSVEAIRSPISPSARIATRHRERELRSDARGGAGRRRRCGPRGASRRARSTPVNEFASVSGRQTTMNGGGAPTSSSSVPCQRLPLDRPARAEQRRRPDAHHPGAERGVEQRPRAGRPPGTCRRRSWRRSPAGRSTSAGTSATYRASSAFVRNPGRPGRSGVAASSASSTVTSAT